MAKHHYLQISTAFQKFLKRAVHKCQGNGLFNVPIVNLLLNLIIINYAPNILLFLMTAGKHLSWSKPTYHFLLTAT